MPVTSRPLPCCCAAGAGGSRLDLRGGNHGVNLPRRGALGMGRERVGQCLERRRGSAGGLRRGGFLWIGRCPLDWWVWVCVAVAVAVAACRCVVILCYLMLSYVAYLMLSYVVGHPFPCPCGYRGFTRVFCLKN